MGWHTGIFADDRSLHLVPRVRLRGTSGLMFTSHSIFMASRVSIFLLRQLASGFRRCNLQRPWERREMLRLRREA